MAIWDDYASSLFSSPTTLLGAVALLLVLYLVFTCFSSDETGKEPPGPRPLPLLGNLLQLDLKRPYKTLYELSEKYGSVFTVHFGTNKVVVLAGYKAVKEALVSYAEEFGDRSIYPIFYDINQGHGILFANGESWKELRRFALTTLRDFGMGKRVAEEKISEECRYLIQVFEKHKGKPFDTTCPVNYATSNIISSIVYGSRFEYSDPRFKNLVRRAHENICIIGSASVQLYNMFPRLVSWIKNRQLILKNVKMTVRDNKDLIKQLEETLNPHTCRGLVDCFLIRKQKEESSTSFSLLLALVGLLFLQLLYSSFSSQENRRDPPGPKPLPLLGNLHQLDLNRLYNSLFDLSKKHGPVFTVYFGLKKVVVLAGYRTVKQALVNHAEEFGDRDINPIFYDFNKGNGVLFANGDSWKEMRRFALSTLREFGMGKKISEQKIIEECHHLADEFQRHEGKAFSNAKTVTYAASNIISGLMFGRRFDYNDHDLQSLVERDHEAIRLTGSASIMLYNIFPWLGPCLKNRRDLLRLVEANKMEARTKIAQLNETLNPEMCRCFIDAFLTRKQNLKESGIKDSHYHNDNLLYSVTTLFSAGTDTTGSTLQWCLLLMAKYPHIQERVQEELSREVGSRQIRVEDRKNLPYTDAVIHETQRVANVAPMSVPHKTSRDVNFQGYFIKEGTTVFPLLTSVLYDENEWESPQTFNPSHFLDREGKFVRRDAFMPFSAGRRVCLGESLARMELFLFFTSLLQRFRFTPPPGVTEDELDLTPAVGFTLSPLPHELCAVSRNEEDSWDFLIIVLCFLCHGGTGNSHDADCGHP
ncbi:LOW QUALITY PROTEIN: cytochrome P450 2K1-like [Xiphias gladius]|uniref:LOW QUALITY PROTEIN: cytochrome P450 2K1-like n=1 Tax=Xiphias gladius TaxID=8245 RepID=UPI001A99D1D1|nr:LOW QUALITY PROTEIN: cytochrome P450 2K1-like [Xiphias gladius]